MSSDSGGGSSRLDSAKIFEMFAAAEDGEVETARRLAAEGYGSVFNETGETPLMVAIMDGREGCVEALLPHSDARATNQGGRTPLMLAAWMGAEGITRLLLEASDLDRRDRYGKTALFIAAERGRTGVVRLLLAAGADAGIPDGMGRTPEAAAGEMGKQRAERLLASWRERGVFEEETAEGRRREARRRV